MKTEKKTEHRGENVPEGEVNIQVPGLRDKEFAVDENEQLAPIERQIIHERSMETLAPSGSGDIQREMQPGRQSELATTQGISIYGAQPEPVSNLSP